MVFRSADEEFIVLSIKLTTQLIRSASHAINNSDTNYRSRKIHVSHIDAVASCRQKIILNFPPAGQNVRFLSGALPLVSLLDGFKLGFKD